VVVIPVSDVDRSKVFYPNWARGLTPISSSTTVSPFFCSCLPAQDARFSLALTRLTRSVCTMKKCGKSSLAGEPISRYRRYYRPIVHVSSFCSDNLRRPNQIEILPTVNRGRNMKILMVLTSPRSPPTITILFRNSVLRSEQSGPSFRTPTERFRRISTSGNTPIPSTIR
jgi:hypothetical protein